MDVLDFNVMIEGFIGIIWLVWVINWIFNKEILEVIGIGFIFEDDEI